MLTTEESIQRSQRLAARVTGLMYLFVNATFARSEFVVIARLIDDNDAAKTVTNIQSHERLFRLGVAADLFTFAADVVLLTALYLILKPVSRGLALVAAFWRLVAAAVLSIAVLDNLKIVELLGSAPSSRVVEPGRLRALVMLLIGAHSDAGNVGLLFVALGSVVFGYLWFKSRYIPKALAVWGVFASLLGVGCALVFIVFPDVTSYLASSL